jgi:hypothetical protein
VADSNKVRVYDPDTKTVVTIPATELAPGMHQARLTSVDGPVFVSADYGGGEGHLNQPPFGDEARAIFGELKETFDGVYTKTLDEWEDGFRKDEHPENEIALWLVMADLFRHFTAGRNLNPDQRQDIFQVVLSFVTNGAERVTATVNPRTIARSRLLQMVEYLKAEAPACLERARARVTAALGVAPSLTTAALQAGHPVRYGRNLDNLLKRLGAKLYEYNKMCQAKSPQPYGVIVVVPQENSRDVVFHWMTGGELAEGIREIRAREGPASPDEFEVVFLFPGQKPRAYRATVGKAAPTETETDQGEGKDDDKEPTP